MPDALGMTSCFPFWLCLLLLTACGSGEERAEPRSYGAIFVETCRDTFWGAVGVVAEPFEDVGIKREPIPSRLSELVKNPYVEPCEPVCRSIQEELIALNKLLGPDTGTADGKEKAYVEEGADIAEKQALGFMHNKVSVLPMRGVVRRLSGAEKHQRKLARAYEAGKIRRAFLRGLGKANNCKAQ